MINKAEAILALVPGAEVLVVNNSEVTWIKPSEAPVTEEEIAAQMAKMQAEEQVNQVKRLREGAYRRESDGLFFKAQRGEGSMEDWQAKVQEIKLRYPYPTV